MTPNGNLDLTDLCFICDNEPDGVYKGTPICSECADTLRTAKKQKGHINGLKDAIRTSYKIEEMLRVNFVPEKERDMFDRRLFLLIDLLLALSSETGTYVTLPRLARIFYLEAWARSKSRKATQQLTDINSILAEGKSKVGRPRLRRMEARIEGGAQ